MSTAKTADPVRRLRDALGLNQADFGRRIGRSIQSVQNYERGTPVPGEVLQRMAALAQQEGMAETGQLPRQAAPSAPGVKVKRRVVIPPAAGSSDWHQLLDEILESGNEQVIAALQADLRIFSHYLRLAGTERRQKKQVL